MTEIDCAYPEKDYPFTLFFNGEPMPRWSNCWHLIPMLQRAEELMKDHDEPVSFTQLWHLQCRMDHFGVESEQPETFRFYCLTLGFILIRDEAAILEELGAEGIQYGGTPTDIFYGVRDGLFAMHRRCLEDGYAFWTSGYEANRDQLRNSIRRNRLAPTDPDWFEPPHIQRNRFDTERHLRRIRRDIVSLIGTRQLPKDVRRLIHELPKSV